MKATVSQLYNNGTRIPYNKSLVTVVGDLNLGVSKHPVTGMCSSEAMILADGGAYLLPELYDAHCIVIAAHGFRLRGFEIVNGKEMAQEWWCVPQLTTT